MNDPDEICVNCGGRVVSYHKICPWCGKVWWNNGRIQGQNETVAGRIGDAALEDSRADWNKQVGSKSVDKGRNDPKCKQSDTDMQVL